MLGSNKQAALEWISRNQKNIIETCDIIWNNPELGLQEYKTSKLCADTLEKNGFQLERGVAGMPTAFVATWGSGRPVIGVMAELDALPGLSQRAVTHKEPVKEGAPGHGCGHNVFATSGIMGGIAAKRGMEEGQVKGTVKVLGCPAEETLVGKVFMVRDGYFNGLDACLGNHIYYMNGVDFNPATAMNSFKVEFYGRASHAAASPEQGRSALDAVELMNVGVNFLREHIVQEARIHYVVEDGGLQPNVVPPYARSWYYVRASLREVVEQIYERILKIADGADMMAETTHKIRFLSGCYQVLNNVALSKLVTKEMREIGTPTYTNEEYDFAAQLGRTLVKEEKIAELRKSHLPDAEKLLDIDIDTNVYDDVNLQLYPDKGTGGSSDIGDVSWNTPTVQFYTAGCILGDPGHSWQTTAAMGMGLGHKAAIFGSKIIATTTLDLMTQPDLLVEIQEEFRKITKNVRYKSPLHPDAKPPLGQLAKEFNT